VREATAPADAVPGGEKEGAERMTPTGTDRMRELACLSLAADRIGERLIKRLEVGQGPTITMALDEYGEIGITMVSLASATRELHALLGSKPSFEELRTVEHSMETLAIAADQALRSIRMVTDRLGAAIPVSQPDATGEPR
jgi:hypothetical protein